MSLEIFQWEHFWPNLGTIPHFCLDRLSKCTRYLITMAGLRIKNRSGIFRTRRSV